MANSTTDILFRSLVPAPPVGEQNVVPQTDGGSPVQQISFSMPSMVGDSGSGGIGGAVPAPSPGDAAAGKFLSAAGTFSAPAGLAFPAVYVNSTLVADGGAGGGGGGAAVTITKGDLWGFDTSSDRVPVGADTFVLTADSTQALGLKWAANPAGFTNPMTTLGDMIVGGTGGTATRVAAGTAGLVWTSNGPGAAPTWQVSLASDPDTNVVTFSATANFDLSLGEAQYMLLTGALTAPTVSNASDGVIYTFRFVQDVTGGRAVAWPGNFKGAGIISTAEGTASPNMNAVQSFRYFANDGIYAAVSGLITF